MGEVYNGFQAVGLGLDEAIVAFVIGELEWRHQSIAD
jgi:hypothetical protein